MGRLSLATPHRVAAAHALDRASSPMADSPVPAVQMAGRRARDGVGQAIDARA